MVDLIGWLPDSLISRPEHVPLPDGGVPTEGGPWDDPDAGDLVAVDFDGTLTQGEARYWADEIEQPRESVCEWVRRRYYAGAHVVIWTARPWSQASTIAARLTEWEVPYHGIRCEKGGADRYVDDKSIRPSEVSDAE